MSNILSIINKINQVIDKVRVPAIKIPAILLLCSAFRRPGLSAMVIAARAIKRQSEFGAPTGALPDGSANKMNGLIYVLADEVVREIRQNSVTEGVVLPGGMIIQAVGANAGGPVVVVGTNLNPVKVTGIAR